MKRSLFFLCFLLFSVVGKAQVTFDVNSAEGYPLRYTVIDAVNRYVSVESVSKSLVPNSFAKITIPATVIKSGETEPYHVTEVADDAFHFSGGSPYFNGLKQVILPEGIKRIGTRAFRVNFDLTEFHFPSTLEEIGAYAFVFSERNMKTIDLSNTKITSLPNNVFADNPIFGSFPGVTTIKLPQTLQEIGSSVFSNSLVKTLEIPYNVHSMNTNAFYYMTKLEDIEFKNPVPATITYSNPIEINSFLNYGNDNLQTIYVPIDATVAYKVPASWSQHASKFREKVKIGPHGYTSYYLENENFQVPAGCTAYIIKKVDHPAAGSVVGDAQVVAFAPGKIIPKQTGFILQGTAGKTIVYQANVSGVEEDVTGNLLVGTATEQEFSGAGYKYYLFGYGAKGQGFYHQTGREGNSIKLPAHRAGLKISLTGTDFAPAKELIFNFDDATGINTVKPEAEKKADIIYDLQGRRVVNPSHGIYIVNGKKVSYQ